MTEKLREKYAWPKEKPNRQKDDRGWFYKEAEEIFDKFLSKNTKLAVELGSWLGKSTRYILKAAPNAQIVSIDHWKPSHKWFDNNIERKKYEDYVYETFLYNCWDYKDRLIPLKSKTLDGLQEIHDLGLNPDFIYIDADHYFSPVLADIYKSITLFPEAQIVGDDWNWGKEKGYPIRKAAQVIANEFGYKIVIHGNTWYYET